MNNPDKFNEAYSTFFMQWALENLSPSKQALFITTTFEYESKMRRRRETAGLSVGSYERKAFQHLYNLAAKELVGSNYNRPSKRDQLPRVAAFLDSEGTKFWRTSGEARNIHLHSVWIIPTNKDIGLMEAVDLDGSNATFLRSLGFDAIDVVPVNRTDSDMARVIAYASKMVGFNCKDLPIGMDFEIYPLGSR